jgi:dTDP-4-amino-4,6-dideoxygalactose transaminase
MSVYAAMRRQPALPVTERIAHNVIALPIYNDMSDDECAGVIEAFRRTKACLRQDAGSAR